MKRLLLFFFLIISIFSFTQNFLPFSQNTTWRNEYSKFWNSTPVYQNYYSYRINGDTIINGFSYFIIERDFGTFPYCYLRLDSNNSITYAKYDILSMKDTSEFILYDFSLQIGESIMTRFDDQLVSLYVENIDSVFLHNHYRKRIQLLCPMHISVWIEGIGDVDAGLLYSDFHTEFSYDFTFYAYLLCYSINDTMIYGGSGIGECWTTMNIENFFINDYKIYPNPTTGKIRVEGEDIERIEVMNVQGKTIKNTVIASKTKQSANKNEIATGYRPRNDVIDLSNQPKGIYIIKVTTQKGVVVRKVVLE